MITSSLSIRISLLVAALLAVALIAVTAMVAPTGAEVRADAAASVTTAATVATTSASVPPVTAELVSAKKSKVLSFTPAKLVKVAKKYAGTRYRYGGSSPSGFDCSGFTKYVYAKFGVNLPHSAWAQGKKGKRIAKSKAKPGDLVITAGGAHVGIWVSKGKFIDAPKPGTVVHVRKIYTSNYFIVRVESDTRKA